MDISEKIVSHNESKLNTNITTQSDFKINQLENELKQNKIKYESDLQDLKSQFETKVKQLKDNEVRLNLNLQSAKAENVSLKNNCIGLKLEKDELDKNFKLVEDASRKNEVDAYNMKVEFSNWKFKYKRIQDDINLLKSRALNMENHIRLLIAENEYLKNINKHQTCVVDQFKCEKIGIQKECEKMLMEEQNKSNTLLQTISNRDNSIEKLKNDQYELEFQIVKLNEEMNAERQRKNELKDKLEKSHQMISSNSVALTEHIKKITELEESLKKSCLENDSANQHSSYLNNQLNDQKISHEIHIEELKIQINELNISLLRNSEEKICSDEQIDALKEQVFLNQLDLKEKTNELNKERSKKGYDNFTQTVATTELKTSAHKSIQTIKEETRHRPSAFCQTNRVILCSVATQADEILRNDYPTLDYAKTNSLGTGKLHYNPYSEFSEENDEIEVPGIYTEQIMNMKHSKGNELKNRNLSSSKNKNNTDSAKVFKNNLNSYLSGIKIGQNVLQEKGLNTKNGDEEDFLALNELSRKSKSIKRVKFSETKFEYDERN